MSWIETRYGKKIDPIGYCQDYDIRDIAYALSNLCRFTGHCLEFYTVAEHSVRVSRQVPPEHKLWGLLHDATEAYLGDMSSPVKLHCPDYKAIEDHIHRELARKFGLDETMPDCVKEADLRMLSTEHLWLFESGIHWELDKYPPYQNQLIKPWSPREARGVFLDEFFKLTEAV